MDETDIETLIEFVLFLNDKNERENEQYVTLNGRKYRKVSSFSQRI